jgi:hypothetical protein
MLRLRVIFLRTTAACFLCGQAIDPGPCTVIKWRMIQPTQKLSQLFGLGHFHQDPCAEAMVQSIRNP